VLLEARAFASAFDTAELLENKDLIEKAKKRVEIAIRGFPWPFGDPLEDVLTFGLGMLIVSQIRDRRVWERWAEAEAKRIEAFLNLSDDDILEVAWKDLIIRAERCTEEEKRAGLPFKIHVTDYFRLAKGIEGVEWRQKRTVSRGWVYVTRGELVRLISEEAKLRILRKLETAPRVQIKMVQKIIEDIKRTLTLP
jgi:DNA primase large subunit